MALPKVLKRGVKCRKGQVTIHPFLLERGWSGGEGAVGRMASRRVRWASILYFSEITGGFKMVTLSMIFTTPFISDISPHAYFLMTDKIT